MYLLLLVAPDYVSCSLFGNSVHEPGILVVMTSEDGQVLARMRSVIPSANLRSVPKSRSGYGTNPLTGNPSEPGQNGGANLIGPALTDPQFLRLLWLKSFYCSRVPALILPRSEQSSTPMFEFAGVID
jgi:hypothetical protein